MFVISAKHRLRCGEVCKSYWTGACFGARRIAQQFVDESVAEKEIDNVRKEDLPAPLNYKQVNSVYYDFKVEPMGVTD